MDPTTTPEAPAESEEPEDTESSVNDVSVNAVKDTESVISVSYVNDPETDTTANTAEVIFLGGCVNSEKKLAEGRDLKFRVELSAGRSLSKVEVKTVDGETETAVTASESGGVYTVDKAVFVKGSGETATALNGKIIVTTKKITYKVSFDGTDSVSGSYKIYPVEKKDNTEVLGTEITGSTTTDVAFGDSGKFALELTKTGDTVANKLDSIILNGEKINATESELNKQADEANAAKTKCLVFAVDPSKAGDLGETTTADTVAKVNVKVIAKATLTVAFDNANSTLAGVANPNATTQINYDGGKFGEDSTFVEDDTVNLAKTLVFKVTPNENYKVTDVTAKKTTAENADGTTVPVSKGTPVADGSVECAIALTGVGSFTEDTDLTISIATALDDSKEAVHVINFKNTTGNAPEHVNITHGASNADEELENSSLTVTGDTYKIKVDPAAGYDLAKGTTTEGADKNDDKFVVTIKENRVYTVDSKPVEKTISREVEAYDTAAKEITLTLKDSTGDKLYKDNATDEDAAVPFVVKSVDVVIDTKVQENDGEKLVHFTDILGAGYKITTDGVIHNEEDEDEEDSYVVPETVNVLTFTVTSAKAPTVTVDSTPIDGTVAEGVYTYSVPAMALLADGVTEIEISPDEMPGSKLIKVKAVADDVTVKVGNVEETLSGEDADGYYTLSATPTEGDDITLNFIPKPGVTIDKVSYNMGEITGEAVPDRKGNVELKLTVTDTVIIDVASKSDYRVKLTSGTDDDGNPIELKQDGDAYVVDYTAENIGIELTKAGAVYGGNLYDVVVKDGAKTAATEAEVNGAKATIKSIDKTERGKDLTIEVYINKNTKYTATLKTNAVSDAVTISRMVNGKSTTVVEDATVEIMPDARMAFTVAPAKGSTLNDLDVEILAKDGTALTEAASPIAQYDFEDGTLTVVTKPGAAKDAEVLVSVYNKHEEKASGVTANTSLKGGKFLMKLTDPLVKTAEISKVNAVAGSGTNRAVRLNVSVDFKNKKNLPAMPVQGDLYYKVELTAPTGAPTGVTVIPATTKYVKVDDFANTAKTVEVALVTAAPGDDSTVTPAVLADIAETISTTAKVTLVQSVSSMNLATETTVAETDYVAGPEAAMKDNTLTTKAPIYETKLTVKSVNGATVFTGQSDAKVATPVFGKTTAYDDIKVEFVDTKSGVRYGDRYRGFTARVADDNSILVSASSDIRVNSSTFKTMLKTFGVKVTAVAPDQSYAASAVVKLKVQQGIYSVAKDESKAKLPETIYMDSAKPKAASVKVPALLNGGSKEYKPAKSAVTWEIDRADGNTSTYAASALTGKKPLVSVNTKNGTVSVTKDYKVQPEESDNKFTVTIRANDFVGNGADSPDGNGVKATYTFEITDEKNEIGKLVVLDAEGNVQDPATLTAEDFDYWNHNYNNGTDDKSKYLNVYALKKGTKDADSYNLESDVFLPVTFKSSNAKALAVDTASGLLTFYKPADKIKITATTVDGGKAPKAELVINVKPYKQVGLSIVGKDNKSGLDETDIHYSGGNNEAYELYPHYAAEQGWKGISDYKNLKITVKGGKFIANKNWAKNRGNYMGYAVVVTDKNGKATITVTDTANKDKNTNHKDYTITNDSYTTVKAPSIKLYDPKKVAADTEEITWQVTDKNNDNYAGSFVKLTPDFTVTASNPAYDIVGEKGTILKIDENGRFTLYTGYLYSGAYKMVATVGTMAGGEFVASAKDVKLSFSLPAKKIKTTMTVKNSYTLDAKSASTAWIDVKTDVRYEVSSAMNVIKKVQGKDDHTNRFTEFFEVKEVIDDEDYVYGYTIGLKPGLSAEQLDYITSKEGKDDCTGYITVSNGYSNNTGNSNLTNKLNTKDVQVKISFKANKYSLTGATIFSNGTATTPVTATVRLMNGKVRDYAALAAIDATDDGKFAAATNALSFTEDGDIVISSKAAAIEPGKYDVKLIVIPQSSGFVTWDAANKKWIPANTKTENGQPLTQDELIAKAGIPVTAKIDVKAVDTKSIAKVKNLNVTLRTDNEDIYSIANVAVGSGYVQATPTTGGYYQVDVPYSIAINGSDIAAAADSVKVNLSKKSGETTIDQNKVTVAAGTTEDLVKASKAVGYDDDGNGIPVIRLQVSKKALVALTNMPKADKPFTGYGKKLKVPVEIKYTNGITTTDTLNFNITMPKNAPATFEEVQKTVADNKAVIEKIQTKLLDYGASEDTLNRLLDDVWIKVSGMIPADTDVRAAYEYEKKYLNDGEELQAGTETDTPAYDEIMEKGKAKVTMTLTDTSKASANTADVSWMYTLGLNVKYSDVGEVLGVISTFANAYDFTNETTAASLLADIKADDAVKPYLDSRKANLSLKVAFFSKTEATPKAEGTITARILAKDLVSGYSDTVEVGGEDNIPRLSTLTEAKNAITDLFTDAKVLAYVNDCSGQDASIKLAVQNAAKQAVNNKEISIDFKADTTAVKGWDYLAPTPKIPAVTDEEGNETTPAVAAKDGHIAFTLVLAKKQADGTRTAEVKVSSITIPAANADKYVKPADMKKRVEDEIKAPEKLKTLVATAATPNNADAIKTVISDKFTTLTGSVEGYELTWAKTTDNKDDFTYVPATQKKDGTLSFKAVLTLKGADTSETISVDNVTVVDKDDTYQTKEELREKIEAIGTTAAPIKAATVPADKTAANTALLGEITNVNKAVPAITVTAGDADAVEGVAPTAYTATPETNPTKGEYKNVKITIGTGDDAIEFIHDFNFAKEETTGA